MTSYDPKWLEEDRKRMMDMERWYVLDGRHLPDTPMHGFYTGLAAKGKELDGELGCTICSIRSTNGTSYR